MPEGQHYKQTPDKMEGTDFGGRTQSFQPPNSTPIQATSTFLLFVFRAYHKIILNKQKMTIDNGHLHFYQKLFYTLV